MKPTSTDVANHDLIKLAALHKHWVIADSVNFHLRRSVADGHDNAEGLLPVDLLTDLAMNLSVFAAIGVWYALLHVVVEGYRELGYRNPQIDALLAKEEYSGPLRRFRNAMFHYQPDPLSAKLFDFLKEVDSEKWVRELNSALKRFFEERLADPSLE